MDTLLDPNLTYHYDKVSCMKGAYYAHITFSYLILLSGIACFGVRLVPQWKWTHVWFGRAYIIFMLWATATSLLIHNSGLPPAVLISFVWVLGGMCIAWILIKFHELQMDKLAFLAVQKDVTINGLPDNMDLRQRVAAEKGRIAASKTFKQRLFSIKAAHGIIMFVSWINIAGRIFASDQSGDFTCHTYPVYKPITTKHFSGGNSTQLTLLPKRDPAYNRLPWAKLGTAGWGAALLLGPLFGAALVGALWSWWEARRVRVQAANKMSTASAAAALSDLGHGLPQPEKVQGSSGMRILEVGAEAT